MSNQQFNKHPRISFYVGKLLSLDSTKSENSVLLIKLRNLVICLLFCFCLNIDTSIGQSYTFKNINLQGMGYITGIIAHATSNSVYARTDVYGIYKWDEANQKWWPLMDGKVETASIESFAVSPDPDPVIYSVNGNNESGRLYKSSDYGNSWTELPDFNSHDILVEGNGSWRGAGERLSVDPNNGGQTLYFGSRLSGLWKSNDAGSTWTQIPTDKIPAGSSGGVIFVVFDPTSGDSGSNSQRIYAGVQGHGVFQSNNSGTDWTLLAGGPSTATKPCRAAISSDGILYITYSSSDGGGASGYVYKYLGTGNLTNITPTEKSNEGFWGIAVDKTNSNRVATFQWNPENEKGIHYSENGGTTWTSKSFSRPNFRIEPEWYPTWAGWTYTAAMIFDPGNNSRVWLTTGFAAYRTENISAISPMWQAKMNNFEELVVTIVKCPPLESGAALLTGFADQIGLRITDINSVPSKTFEPNGFGITTCIAYCESDPSFVTAVGGNQNGGTNWESGSANYKFSADNGITWTSITPPTATSVNGNIAISSTNKNHWVLAPKDRLGTFNDPYYTLDAGKNWLKSKGTPAETENGCTEQWSGSEFLISDKINGSTFYYYADRLTGGGQSGFYKSIDGGANFTLMYTQLPSEYRSIIAALPGREGHIYYCSKKGSKLYVTTNGGSQWDTLRNIEKCFSIGFGKAIAPSTDPTLFVLAIINGKKSIYHSTDLGKNWTDISDNNLPGNIANITGDMRTPGLVYLATGGRGIFCGEMNAMVSVSDLNLSHDSISITGGSTFQLSATIVPADATVKNIIWRTTETDIALVDDQGLITGISDGNVAVIATTLDGNFSDTTYVTVNGNKINITGISIVPKNPELFIHESQQIKATIFPSDATIKSIIWISDNPSVASVSNSGYVIGYSVGTANIIAKTFDGNFSDTALFTIIKPALTNNLLGNPGFELGTASWNGVTRIDTNEIHNGLQSAYASNTYLRQYLNIEPNTSYTLKLWGKVLSGTLYYGVKEYTSSWQTVNDNQLNSTPDSWKQQILTFTSNANTSIVEIYVWCSADDHVFADDFMFFKTPIYVNSITLSPKEISLYPEQTSQLSAVILPENATFKNIVWTSSNGEIATVSQSGLVTAIAEGETYIYATTEDGGFYDSTQITINEPINSIDTPILSLLQVYPNPSTGLLFIDKQALCITAYTYRGIPVAKVYNTDKIDLTNYPKGLYIINVISNSVVTNNIVTIR